MFLQNSCYLGHVDGCPTQRGGYLAMAQYYVYFVDAWSMQGVALLLTTSNSTNYFVYWIYKKPTIVLWHASQWT